MEAITNKDSKFYPELNMVRMMRILTSIKDMSFMNMNLTGMIQNQQLSIHRNQEKQQDLS
jgi:hypothetical protein